MAARDLAWSTAVRLASQPSFLHDATIAALDIEVALAGHLILCPPADDVCLTAIQQTESKDVRYVIDVLAGGSAGNATATATH